MSALLFALVLVGCGGGGGSESSDADASGDAPARAAQSSAEEGCATVSEDEVASTTGADVTGSVPLPQGCQWTVTGGDQGAAYEWQLIPVEVYDTNEQAASATSGFEIEAISGLGDTAFRRTQVGGTGDVLSSEVWVVVGDQALYVRSAGLPGSDDVLADQAALAELLADRVG